MNQRRAIRIGVIAGTHDLFDPAFRRHFTGVDHILHAEDIGDRSVIELAGRRIAIRHILNEGGKLTKDGRPLLQ